jgi:hypothetical protein
LRGDDHGDGVVDGQGDEGEEDSGHEEGLGRSVALADLEDGDPEEADTGCRDTDDGGGEEEDDDEKEQDVVDGEDLGGLDEDPVERLEDVDVAEDVTAVGTTDGVLGLVNASDEHRREDDEGEDHEEEAADELERAEEGFSLDPGLDDPVAVLAAGFSSETLAADEGTFFTNKSLELAPVAAV